MKKKETALQELDSIVKEIQKLRDKICFQYYEISQPMEAPLILDKLDKIINRLG